MSGRDSGESAEEVEVVWALKEKGDSIAMVAMGEVGNVCQEQMSLGETLSVSVMVPGLQSKAIRGNTVRCDAFQTKWREEKEAGDRKLQGKTNH